MTLNATFPDLRGRSVFITGGGAGIGAFLTDGFLAQGAKKNTASAPLRSPAIYRISRHFGPVWPQPPMNMALSRFW